MERRETALRISLVVAAVAVGLAAGEVLARLFGPEYQVVFRESIAPSDDAALGYALRPGARDGKARISADGLRDRDYPREKPAGTFRIAAIGDSVTFGSGGPRERSWPKVLETLLAAHATAAAPRFEVLNFGVPGYNIAQVVERLRVLGLDFHPDAVVYGYVLNDPQDFSIEAEALRTLRDDMARRTRDDEGAGLGRWLVHSRLYLMLHQLALQRASQAALRARMPQDPAYEAAKSGDRAGYFRSLHTEGESAARLARGMDTLAELARAHGVPVLVAIFPLFGADHGAGPEALADVHRLVANEAARRGFAVLDLLPVYGAATRAFRSELRIDFLHPDALGQRVAATALLDWICRSQWVPAGALDCSRAADAEDAAVERVVAPALEQGAEGAAQRAAGERSPSGSRSRP